MKIIVAGPRDFKNHQLVYQVLNRVVQKWDVILQGGALGVDTIAARWCRTHHVSCRTYPAEWEVYGNAAGARRNAQMAQHGDVLIAFWNGVSPGTGNMIRQMQRLGKQIMYVRLDDAKAEEALADAYPFYGEERPAMFVKNGKDV